MVLDEIQHSQPPILAKRQERVLRQESSEALTPPQPNDSVTEPYGGPAGLQLPERREELELEVDTSLHSI